MPQDFTFKKGFVPDTSLAHIRVSRVIGPDGKVSLSHARITDDWSLVLESALSRPKNTGGVAFRSAIRKAIFSGTLPSDFTTEQFEDACRREYGKLLARPSIDYRVFFEIVLGPARPATWLAANGCRLYFAPNSSSQFMDIARAARAQAWAQQMPNRALAGPTRGLMPVVAHVRAPTPHEAHQIALDALDEIRGLMNFIVNERRFSQQSFGVPKPINKIRLATIQTVHTGDGPLASEGFWYERDWQDTEIVSLTSGDRPLLARFLLAFRKLRRPRNRLAGHATVALRQYARALDNHEWRNAFLELWVVLEYLTGISNADYEKLISRASYMHASHADMREIAQHLRIRRNEIVHSSAQDDDAEQLIFQAKRLVEPLLTFFIANPFGLGDLEQVRSFLDQPKDLTELRKRQRMLGHALHFRRPVRRPS